MNNRTELKVLQGLHNPLMDKKPKRKKGGAIETAFLKRRNRIAIREASLRGVSIVMLYRKVDNTLKRYELIPISYRYRVLKSGLRCVLFAQDVRDAGQIKQFIVSNIYKVALTKKRRRASFRVEII